MARTATLARRVDMPPPTHPYAGSNSARQSVGDPGHCEDCAVLGHVAAHPDLGCGDVGCNRHHGDEDDLDMTAHTPVKVVVKVQPRWVDMPPPTHPYAGSNSARQSVGDPGHCEDCAVLGHVAAHPDFGCGDVGCNRHHGDEDDLG